jgi:hypothetical protein
MLDRLESILFRKSDDDQVTSGSTLALSDSNAKIERDSVHLADDFGADVDERAETEVRVGQIEYSVCGYRIQYRSLVPTGTPSNLR